MVLIMKRLIFTLIYLLFYCPLYAQYEIYPIKFKKNDAEFKLSMPNRKQFYITEIIDSRNVKPNTKIGIAFKASSNQYLDVVFENSAISFFDELLEPGNFKSKTNEQQLPFVLSIKEVEVSEWTGGVGYVGDVGRAVLVVSFLKNLQDTISVYTARIAHESQEANPKTTHAIKLRECLSNALYRFENFLANSNQPNSYTNENINDNIIFPRVLSEKWQKNINKYELRIQSYPDSIIDTKVLLNAPRRYGLYLTLDEYLKNQPKIIDNFTTNFDTKKQILEIHFNSKNKQINDKVFGFSDGKDFYIHAKNYSEQPYFKKIIVTGTISAWEDIVDLSSTYGSPSGGLLGTATNKMMYPKNTFCFAINTRTWRLMYMGVNSTRSLLKSYPKLLATYQNAESLNNSSTILYYIQEYNKRNPLK
jgi:hypothetical protein